MRLFLSLVLFTLFFNVSAQKIEVSNSDFPGINGIYMLYTDNFYPNSRSYEKQDLSGYSQMQGTYYESDSKWHWSFSTDLFSYGALYFSTNSSEIPSQNFWAVDYLNYHDWRDHGNMSYPENPTIPRIKLLSPIVRSSVAKSITCFGATPGGKVIDMGNSDVTSSGIHWGTDPSNLENTLVIGSGGGIFSGSLDGLLPNITYYYKAYATNGYDTSLGELLNFNTFPVEPVVTTNDALSIGSNAITIGGTITSPGGTAITSKGIAFGTSPNPDSGTASLTGNNSYTVDFNNLDANVTYYYRAYATNSYGTSYGKEGKIVITNTTSGNALSFDGSDDYISLPQAVYFNDNTFTVEGWVYLRSRNNYCRLFDFGNGSGNDNILLSFAPDGAEMPRLDIYVGNNSETMIWSDAVIPLNTWTHIACVVDGSEGYMFMNGVLVGQGSGIPLINPVIRKDNYIGKSNWSDNGYTDFTLDEFHIWNTARTVADIRSDMVFGVNPSNPDLMMDFDFNQGVAGGDNSGLITIPDKTGKGNNGTLHNFALNGSISNYVDSYGMVIPVTVGATNKQSSSFTANWLSPANGVVEKYYLDVATDEAFTSKLDGFSLKDVGNAISCTVDGLNAGPTYYYRVAAYNASAKMSPWSNTTSVTVSNAAIYTVTNGAESEYQAGTLKYGIAHAANGDYINFDVGAMGTNTIKLTSPVVINKNLTIQGADAGIVLTGGSMTKVLEIGAASEPQPVVRLEKLTITNGNDQLNVAGGITNAGTLTMMNCLITDNIDTGVSGGIGATGGIFSSGLLTLGNCTISGNKGAATDYGTGGIGGSGKIYIYNTILYGNEGQFGNISGSTVAESNNSLYQESATTLTTSNSVIFSQADPSAVNKFESNPKFVGKENNSTYPYLIFGFSPCVDGGNDLYSKKSTDIRGGSFGRKLDKATGSTGTIDIGAYEWKKGTDPNNVFIWTGGTGKAWNIPGNWDLSDVPQPSDIVIVPNVTNKPEVSSLEVASGGQLTIHANSSVNNSGIVQNNGVIIIKSDEYGTGSLISSENAIGSGYALVERYMTKNQWHIISSPIGIQTINNFLNDNIDIPIVKDITPVQYAMMDYNPGTNNWSNYFTDATSGTLGIGKGYMVQIMEPVQNLRFQGIINATATVAVTEGWNCIGNPFISAIKVNDLAGVNNFIKVNENAFDTSYGALYFWNQSDSKYEEVTLDGDAFNAAIGQGFFMKVKAGVPSVTFTPEMQVHQIDAPFKSKRVVHPSIKLKAQSGAKSFTTDLLFIEGATKGLDFGYDAGLFTTDKSFSLYTKLVEDNGIQFQLQCLPPTGYDKMVIPIGIDSKAGGEIVFSVQTVQLAQDCNPILEDKLTNTFTDLFTNTYKVAVAANTAGTGRFYLHTGDIVSGLEDHALSKRVTAYANSNKEIHVLGEVANDAVATLVNGLGKVVLTKKLGAGTLNIIGLPNLSSGVYFLNINDKGTTQTIKVMVRKK